MRHFHGDGDDVHVVAVHERLVIVEREWDTEDSARGIGGFTSAGGQRRDLEVIRERLQGRDVRLRGPAAIRIGANDADANSLGSFLAGAHVEAERFRSWSSVSTDHAPVPAITSVSRPAM